MKFSVRSQTAKNILQKYGKKFKRKKNNNNELSSIEDKKVKYTNLCYDERKTFCHLTNSVPSLQGQSGGGACPHFSLPKILFWKIMQRQDNRQ